MFVTVARNIKGRIRRPADSSVLSIATAKFGSNSLQPGGGVMPPPRAFVERQIARVARGIYRLPQSALNAVPKSDYEIFARDAGKAEYQLCMETLTDLVKLLLDIIIAAAKFTGNDDA